ncbi:hypothetical protein GOODEAATRI_024116 [Goodea atripinnis]|uniref:Uncharacterized protein n=1 Tax=Goodea atripinnis TaxID=208336 RepID=A0ABV0PGJ3_9TELE
MRRMGRKPEGEGSRPQGGQGEGRPPADRRPVDRRPPRRFERPAGDAAEKPEGGEFSGDEEHHFRKPANDITSQLEINFGDLGRPGRGRGGPRGGRGGRGRGEAPRPVRGGRTDRVCKLNHNSTGLQEPPEHLHYEACMFLDPSANDGEDCHNYDTL